MLCIAPAQEKNTKTVPNVDMAIIIKEQMSQWIVFRWCSTNQLLSEDSGVLADIEDAWAAAEQMQRAEAQVICWQ